MFPKLFRKEIRKKKKVGILIKCKTVVKAHSYEKRTYSESIKLFLSYYI